MFSLSLFFFNNFFNMLLWNNYFYYEKGQWRIKDDKEIKISFCEKENHLINIGKIKQSLILWLLRPLWAEDARWSRKIYRKELVRIRPVTQSPRGQTKWQGVRVRLHGLCIVAHHDDHSATIKLIKGTFFIFISKK